MKKSTRAVVGGILAIAAVFGMGQAAEAATRFTVNTISGAGQIDGTITFNSADNYTVKSYLADRAADGHGPYAHVFQLEVGDNTYRHVPGYDLHETNGNGSSRPWNFTVPAGAAIYKVELRVCDGGDVNGNGATHCASQYFTNPLRP